MSELHHTQEALAEIAANGLDGFGTHLLSDVQRGVPGLVLGEVVYDPKRDMPGAIVHSSVRELVTGRPQVRQYAPQQLLTANVIIHDRKSTDSFGMYEAKTNVATELRQALRESMPGLTDEVFSYAVGETAGTRRGQDMEIRATNGDPLVDAKTIGDLCKNGLSFIISDFLNLPLEKVPGARYPATVGVKINHPIEIKLPPNVGTLPTIAGGEVNTNKSKQLQRVNEALQSLHNDTVRQLGRLGIGVAHVVIAPKLRAQYDVTVADTAISRAIGQIKPF